jgi:hypothetical protein
MKSIKKTMAALALASMMLPGIAQAQTQPTPDGPLETYANCIDKCVSKYASWTLRRSICAADCYIGFIGNMVDVIAS